MAKITFLTWDGCLFFGIAGLVDAFGIANLWQQNLDGGEAAPRFECEIVSRDGQPVTAHGGIRFTPHRSLAEVGYTDFVVIPPFLPLKETLAQPRHLPLEWIAAAHARRTPIGAMCTGVFALAETGVLDGKAATTNWQFVRLFQRRYPRVRLRPEAVITIEDGLVCTGAAAAFFKLALYLIRSFGSEQQAEFCSKALLVDPNLNSQTPYAILDFPRDHGDGEILKAQRWMEANFAETIPIDALARRLGISPRHFKRRFKLATGETPLGYLQRVRIEAARQKLAQTHTSLDAITRQVGYEDGSSFRRLFRRHTGLSPRAYRDKFGRQTAKSI